MNEKSSVPTVGSFTVNESQYSELLSEYGQLSSTREKS